MSRKLICILKHKKIHGKHLLETSARLSKWNLDVPGSERALGMQVLLLVPVVALNGSFEIGIEELGLISV